VRESALASGAMPPEEVVQLPGARRHCARIAADLEAGLTCLWLLPDAEVQARRADLAVDAVLHRFDDVVDVPGPRAQAGPDAAPVASPTRAVTGWSVPHMDDEFDLDDGFGDDEHFGAAVGHQVSPRTPTAAASSTGQDAGVADRLARSLGLVEDLVAEVVAAADGRTPVLVVRAWTEDDPSEVSRLLRRFQAAVKESGLKPEYRPRLLVAARLRDLEADMVGSLDQAVARQHWWWGVWSHLDTATVVADAVPQASTGHLHERMTAVKYVRRALRCETVVQVAGPDLALAVDLARAWNGDVKDLASALSECRDSDSEPTTGQGSWAAGAAYAPAPEAALRAAWAAGSTDSWEGRVRGSLRAWRSAVDSTEPLDKLVWQAQNRVLLPLMDDARLGFVELLPHVAVRGVDHLVRTYIRQSLRSGNGTSADLQSMEFGEIYDAAVHRDVKLTSHQFHKLGCLRSARNKLAHRTALDDVQLQDVLESLSGP
jgi:hypothetical protein